MSTNCCRFLFYETVKIFLFRTKATRNTVPSSPTWSTQMPPALCLSLSWPRGCSSWPSPSSTRSPTPPPTSSSRSKTRDCDWCTRRRRKEMTWNDWRYHRTCKTSDNTSCKWQSNQFKTTFSHTSHNNGLTRFPRTFNSSTADEERNSKYNPTRLRLMKTVYQFVKIRTTYCCKSTSRLQEPLFLV